MNINVCVYIKIYIMYFKPLDIQKKSEGDETKDLVLLWQTFVISAQITNNK